MERTVLLLLTCLLLALRTVAQAPEKAAPDDLVVTAEIVGYEYLPAGNQNGNSALMFSAKMVIRNTTNQDRKIAVMRCSWDWSWTSNGAYSICGTPGCDGNSPDPITISAGQTIEFYDRLCPFKRYDSQSDSVKLFRLGFVDVAFEDYMSFAFFRKNGKLSRKPVVYWSNELRDDVRPIAIKEVMDKVLMRKYELLGESK